MPFACRFSLLLFLFGLLLFSGCQEDEPFVTAPTTDPEPAEGTTPTPPDLAASFDYAGQPVPDYVRRDNSGQNTITDVGATLGRVLFYDRQLSATGTISCASCHRQELAFGDHAIASAGVAGTTPRHSMRLINARFGEEPRFFWDERAATLEAQTTQPIKDHIEMGFSGQNGDLSLNDLLGRLNGLDYYDQLFTEAFGSAEVTETRLQEALAQFIRSIQSFDSKYDAGRALVRNGGDQFPNFTEEENRGRELFGGRPQVGGNGQRVGGGLGCGSCHREPEFAIDPASLNNGVTTGIGAGIPEFSVTRAPSLRDLFQPDGTENGPFMHNGAFASLNAVLDHYNVIPDLNPQLDRRLIFAQRPQRLNITPEERQAVLAFLKTLTGTAVYSDERWSNPFVE